MNKPIQRVQVIINPAASQNRPVLNLLNLIFQERGLEWDVSVTNRDGDGCRLAKRAVDAGFDVVAACGGDGTVMDVANGLIGTEIPLAILPSGTGNVLVTEFGISRNLEKATRLICDGNNAVKTLDVGQINNRGFLLRAGSGLEARVVRSVTHRMKRRYGVFSYVFAGILELIKPGKSHYELTLDGKKVETDGIACLVANAGTLGQLNMALNREVDPADGLLDVFIVDNTIKSLLTTATSLVLNKHVGKGFQHWQAHEVTVVSDPPQPVQADGDYWENMTTPFEASILPQAIRLIVPNGIHNS